MKASITIRYVFIALAAFVALVVLCPEASAQCPMCRTAISNSGAKAMNVAILVLLIPPVSIFCSVFALAYRYRKAREDDDRATGNAHHPDKR